MSATNQEIDRAVPPFGTPNRERLNAVLKKLRTGGVEISDLLDITGVDGDSVTVQGRYRGGTFSWVSGDQSASVAVDPGQGVWVAGAGDATGASGAWRRNFTGPIYVNWFLDSEPGTDDTQAIDNAMTYAFSRSGRVLDDFSVPFRSEGELRFSAGRYYYAGNGYDADSGSSIRVRGEGEEVTELELADGSYFIDTDDGIPLAHFSGIHVHGGAAFFRQRNTGAIVSGGHTFEEMTFADYTRGAILYGDTTDRPFVIARKCNFHARPGSDSISITLPPGGGHLVTSCWFNSGRVDIKCYGLQLAESLIDFNRFGSRGNQGGYRCNIWVVPSTFPNNGRGITITNNYHGNENIDPSDFRILFAPEGAGSAAYDKLPSFTSTNDALNHIHVENNGYAANDGTENSPIVSYTAQLSEMTLHGYCVGGLPEKAVDIRTSTDISSPRLSDVDVFFYAQNQGVKRPMLSGLPSASPNTMQLRTESESVALPGDFPSDYVDLLTDRDGHADFNVALASKSRITDSLGGDNATEITTNVGTGAAWYTIPATNLESGRLLNFAVDLAAGSANSAEFIQVTLYRGTDTTTPQFQRTIPVGSSWVRHHFQHVTRQSTQSYRLNIVPLTYRSGAGTQYKVGRPCAYFGRTGVNYGHMRSMDSAWNREHLVLGDRHVWEASGSLEHLRTHTSQPTADGDGKAILLAEPLSWTPTLAGATTAGSHTYNTNGTFGRIQRFGPIIFISGRVALTSKDTSMAGPATVPLPPLGVSNAEFIDTAALSEVSGVTIPASTILVGRAAASSDRITFFEFGSGGTAAPLDSGDCSDTTTLRFSAFMFVADPV